MCLCQYFLFNPSGQRTAWIQLWYCTTWAGAKVISVGMWLNQLPFIILTWSDMCSVAMLKAFAEFEYRWSVACQFLGHLNDLNNRPDLASLDPTETLRLLILILALKDLTQFKTTRVRLKRIPSQQESWTAAVGQIPHWYTSCIFMPSIFLLHVPRNSLFRKDRFHTSQHPRLRQASPSLHELAMALILPQWDSSVVIKPAPKDTKTRGSSENGSIFFLGIRSPKNILYKKTTLFCWYVFFGESPVTLGSPFLKDLMAIWAGHPGAVS